MQKTYFFQQALLPSGWFENVLIKVNQSGVIENVVTDAEPTEDSETVTGIMIPGMPNLHSHAFQRGFAGFSESRGQANDSFWSWRKIMYQFVDKLTPQQTFVIARQLYIEMLKAGYTSVAEFHYLHHDIDGNAYQDPLEMSHQVINAAFETGINITHLPVYYRYSGFNNKTASPAQKRFIHTPSAYNQLLDGLFSNYADDQRVNIGIAPHSLRAVNVAEINSAIEQLDGFTDAKIKTAPIHIHIAEQMAEVNDCLAFSKQRPVQHLLDNCEVNERWCLIHATHINEQETWEIAQSGAVVGICPTTEANLGDGIFPADFYLQQGGHFGIGSDSHISVSAIEELRLLEYSQRLKLQKRAILCDQETASVGRYLYQGALLGGAQAIARQTAKIEKGYQADWIVLDENNPALFSKNKDQILNAMIFSSNNNPVKAVMVLGRWVIKDYSHPMQEQSLAEFKQVLKQLID